MAFTKITAAGIGSTESVTLDGLSVINNGSFGGNLTLSGVLTYEDVTNVDSVGLITARNGIVVGSGITLSKDGDVFFTGIATGNGSGLTNLPAANLTGTLPAISGANLTNLDASDLASGTVPTARLGSGTASSSTFLRGDSTFAAVTSTTINNNANNYVITGSGTANTLEAEANLTFTGSILTVTNSSGASELTLVTPNNTDGGVYFNDGTNSGALTYQHSDDSMRFRVNTTEKARITSEGKLCINNDNALSDLHVCTAGSSEEDGTFRIGGSSASLGLVLEYDQSSNTTSKITSNPTYTNTSALLKISVDGDANANQLVLQGDGDIGVGVESPDGRFHIMGGNLGGAGSVNASTAANLLVLESNTSQGLSLLNPTDERASIYFGTTGTNGDIEAGIQYAHESVSTSADRRALIFRAGGGERVRIQGGMLRVGASLASASAGRFQVIEEDGTDATNDCNAYFETNAADWNIKTYYNRTGAHYHMSFVEQGSDRGNISGADGSNVGYNSGSDHRWKENVVRMTGDEGIEICKKLKPSKYNWIENREATGKINTVDGFIAHEVEEAGVLGAVTGEKDAVYEDGSIKGQMLDYGQVTPVLSAAIKGLIDKVETLEAEVAALKSS